MEAKLSVLSKSCILFVLCEVCGAQRSPEAGVLCMACTFDWYICADTVASLCFCSIFVAELGFHRFQVEERWCTLSCQAIWKAFHVQLVLRLSSTIVCST